MQAPHRRLISTRKLGLFVEGIGAGLAAEPPHAVERLFAIPARAFGGQVGAGGRGAHGGGNRDGRRLERPATVRKTFISRFQDPPPDTAT